MTHISESSVATGRVVPAKCFNHRGLLGFWRPIWHFVHYFQTPDCKKVNRKTTLLSHVSSFRYALKRSRCHSSNIPSLYSLNVTRKSKSFARIVFTFWSRHSICPKPVNCNPRSIFFVLAVSLCGVEKYATAIISAISVAGI